MEEEDEEDEEDEEKEKYLFLALFFKSFHIHKSPWRNHPR